MIVDIHGATCRAGLRTRPTGLECTAGIAHRVGASIIWGSGFPAVIKGMAGTSIDQIARRKSPSLRRRQP